MKKNILYVALAGISLLFAGCNDDLGIETPQAVEKHYGEEINFGGSASYNLAGKESGNTRTVYGGYTQGATEEPVYWVSTDQVRLFCNEAAVKTADYQVTTTASDASFKVTSTGLNKTGAAGLQWGDPESAHTFYGVYPIPSDNSLKESQILTGEIPDVQVGTHTETDGKHVFAPNMDCAYMVAKTAVSNPNAIGDNVYLKFAPIATALEVEILNNSGEALSLREVHFSSATHKLSGEFTADLDKMSLGAITDGVQYASGCPTDIDISSEATSTVGVRLLVDGSALTLAKDETVKFTVFMLPSKDGANEDAVSDLEITLIGDDGGKKTGTFTGVNIAMSKKNYIHNLPLGTGDLSYDQSEWVKYVEDSKTLNALSIPGAGGASSGINNDGSEGDVGLTSALWSSNSDYYEQSLSIEELWSVGIRCFEFTVDYADSYDTDGNPVTDGSLNNNVVYCNAQPTGLTLDQCVSEVKRLLGEHPEEFAMVIITYQQKDGWDLRNADGTVAETRKSATFMSQLKTYWDSLDMPDGTQKALYSSDMTVETARGSLFCIARPTSQGEDNYAKVVTSGSSYILQSTTYSPLQWDTSVTVPDNVLVVHGWGALKDKWYVRGFTDCVYFRFGGNKHFDVLLNGGGWNVEAKDSATLVTMLGYRGDRSKKPGRPFESSSKSSDFNDTNIGDILTDEYADVTATAGLETLEYNFHYSVITSKDNGVLQTNGAWVQEWARVSKTSTAYPSNSGYTYWLSSIDEKKAHITDCLTRSIGKDETDKTIYINSLCGYYIIDGTELTDETQIANAKLSASGNSLTECNVANSLDNSFWGDWKFSPLTGANNKAGMCGDIANFATDINAFFLTELNNKLSADKRLAGSTGIILMDRVSNSGAGAEIPSIIIANNFAPDQNASEANTFSIQTSNLESGDTPAAPARRDSQPAITWGEWTLND